MQIERCLLHAGGSLRLPLSIGSQTFNSKPSQESYHLDIVCTYMINQTSRGLNKAKQINSPQFNSPEEVFFPEKNWLPQVGFETHDSLLSRPIVIALPT